MFDKLMEETYNFAMGYLRKALENQMEEQRHITFSNLILKIKLCEAVEFICYRETGVYLKPDKLDEDCTGTINKIVALLGGRHKEGRSIGTDHDHTSLEH